MHLHDFDRHIDQYTLTRALLYARFRAIASIERIDEGEFLAVIVGTQAYDVYVRLDPESKVVQYQCSCPKEAGEVCKHIGAVLYKLRNARMESIPNSQLGQEIKAVVDTLQPDQLRQILCNILKRHRDLRAEIMQK